MNRNSLVLVALAVLAAMLVWLLWRADPEPRLAVAPVEQQSVPTVAVPEVAAKVQRDAVVAAPSETVPAASPGGTGGDAKVAAKALSGVVKEIDADGLPGVQLDLVDAAGLTVASVISGKGGRFAFEGPIPADVSLVTQLSSGAGPRLRHKLYRGRSNAPVTNMTVWVPLSGMIEGSVVDATGQPVAGALVQTDRPSVSFGFVSWDVVSGPPVQTDMYTKTDAAGHFVLSGMHRGVHRLQAVHDGAEGSARCAAFDLGVVLQLGTHLGGAVVIAGHVRDRVSNAPITGATVFVQLVREVPGGTSSVGVARLTSDEQGYYEAMGLEVGSYQLSVHAPGFAPPPQPLRECSEGRHTIDFTLDPARELLVRVLLPDGSPPSRVELRVLDAAGRRLQVPGKMRIMTDALKADKAGRAKLRLLPAAPLTLLAVRGDLFPAGRLDVDLSTNAPESVTIMLPSGRGGFARTHYFKLLGPEGKPAQIEGTVVAESFDGDALLSRVEGHMRAGKFVFGFDERNDFDQPTIAVGAPAGACRVEIAVPGYQKETLTLAPDATSPTSVRLRH